MIEIRSTSIVIHNYIENQKLEKSLSVWDDATFQYVFQAFKKTEDENGYTMIVPKGYGISRIKTLFPHMKVIDNSDKVIVADKLDLKCVASARNATQQNAINFINNSDYYVKYGKTTQNMVALETGGGKTFVAIFFSTIYKKIPMIIVDQNKIIRQWKEEYLKLTNIEDDEIGIISGESSIKKILKDHSKYKVYIASHKTLAAYMKKDSHNVSRLFQELGIGLKIYDEAHVEWKSIIDIDLSTNVGKTVYLTATPSRSNRSENYVYQNVFNSLHIFGLANKYNEEKIYHKIVYVKFNTKPTLDDIALMNTKRGFNCNEYYKYLMKDSNYDTFSNMILKVLNIVLTQNKDFKIAIIVHTLEFLSKLKETLENEYPNISVGNFSGLVKDIQEKDNELNKQLILTTDKSFDKAINVMDLSILINTVPLSSKVKTEQMMGRLRYVKGKECMYFDITDVGFPACKNQFKVRSEIFKLKAKKIFEINL